MEASRHVKLSLVCLLSTFAPKSMALVTALDAASSFGLLSPRDQNSCSPGSGLDPCPQGINFCCFSGSTCLPTTADNSSVICCPSGSDCQYIKTISCDISLFNSTANAFAPVHSSQLDQDLPKCGDGCCPFGYDCLNGGCYLSATGNQTSDGVSSASDASSPSISPMPVPSAPAEAPTVTQTITASEHNSAFPPGAVGLGLALGLLAGVGATLLGVFLLRRRRKRKSRPEMDKSPSFLGTTPKPLGHSYNTSSSSQHTISQPVWAPGYGQSHRTDFLLRRGETETSYEQSAKPPWSSANESSECSVTQPSRSHSPSSKITTPERGRTGGSMRSRTTTDSPAQALTDTPSSQMSTRKDRMPPLFAKPLKFGQELRPAKSLRSNPKAPARPPRSDEGSPAPKTAVSQRDPSQQRPLLVKDDTEIPTISLARADSSVSAKDHCPDLNNTTDRESTGTITFLMTPAEIGRSQNRTTTNTTWSGMLHEIYGDVDHELGKYSAPKK